MMASVDCIDSFDIVESVTAYSNIAIVLAGFALAALVLIADRAAHSLDGTRAQAAGGFLTLALVILILAAVMMSITQGEVEPHALRPTILISLSATTMGLGLALLVLAVLVIVRDFALAPSLALTVASFGLFSVAILGSLVITVDDVRNVVEQKCTHPHRETAAIIALAYAPASLLALFPDRWMNRVSRSVLNSHEGLWGFALAFVVVLLATFPFVASADSPTSLSIYPPLEAWLAFTGLASVTIGWEMRLLLKRLG
jgi:hypothetical protein